MLRWILDCHREARPPPRCTPRTSGLLRRSCCLSSPAPSTLTSHSWRSQLTDGCPGSGCCPRYRSSSIILSVSESWMGFESFPAQSARGSGYTGNTQDGKYEYEVMELKLIDQFSGFTTMAVKLWRSDQQTKIKLILD